MAATAPDPAALANAYATVEDFRTRFQDTDAAHEDQIGRALIAASSFLEAPRVCGQRFWKDAETRVYSPDRYLDECLEVDPFVVSDATPWTLRASWDGSSWDRIAIDQSDYLPYPLIRTRHSIEHPATEIRRTPDPNRYVVPFTYYPLWQLQATFGWPAIPAAITEACLELAGLILATGPRATRQIAVGVLGETIQSSPAAEAVVGALPHIYRRTKSGDLFR